jgi:hypothetical protein
MMAMQACIMAMLCGFAAMQVRIAALQTDIEIK